MRFVRGAAGTTSILTIRAAREFQQIIDNRGTDPLGANWVLAHLGLARAYVLSGDVPRARVSYEGFLALWKDADPSIPIFDEARAEYQHLK